MIIAHDLGTTGNKASLHQDDGRLLHSVTLPYPAYFADGGVAEQNPDDWWAAVVSASQALLVKGNVAASEIKGVALSGQMMGAVLLDSEYRPVRPALIWADHRSGRECQELLGTIGEQVAYRALGHRLNPTYSLTKIMWVRDHEPENFRRIRHVCLAKDYIVHKLTGRLATDRSDASGTDAYDQHTGRWSQELLQAARLDESLFPEIVESTAVVGSVTGPAATATGLLPGTPVVMGGGDGPLAAVGAGIITEDDGAYAYLGSSSWISLSSPTPLYDPQMRTMNFNHVVPGYFVPTATMQAGGASLEWATELLAPGVESGRFARIVAEADTAEASGGGLYFLPHLLGERSPYWNPHAAGAFVGLGRHHGRGHLTRAVLEGVAFNLMTCIIAFRESGARVQRIDAIGGGAASDVWLQIFADVWGIPVRRRSIVEEANSLGAAVTASVGLGLVDDFGVARKLSQVTAEFIPDASRLAAYEKRHSIFLDAYSRLEPWFEHRTES